MNQTSRAAASQSGKKLQQPVQKQLPQQQEQQNSGIDQSSTILAASNVPSNLNSEKMQQIQDKVRELEHLLKIKDMSAQMASYFDELAKSMEGLAGGAQAVSDVLSNWNHVFRTMSMVAPRRAKDEDEEEDTDDKKMETPEETTPVLVRVPLTLTKQISDLSF
ncbi:DASH complex subunit Dad2-domain-containing protein [Umbelopsis sp. PMI_123]|nr:DASH complex subunit Dad2-domain-containing protein [Umbelopsis sp. PMI_123]